MALPSCNFFPQTPLTLFIFEQRYRDMLAHALQTDRMFCVGTAAEGESEAEIDEVSGLYRYGTLGLVRACVKNDDGTSHLILEGLERVRFRTWEQLEPFRIAAIDPVATILDEEGTSVVDAIARLRELVREVQQANVNLPALFSDEEWNDLNPVILADWIANYFISDIHARHILLEEPELEQRFLFLIEWIEGQVAAMKKK